MCCVCVLERGHAFLRVKCLEGNRITFCGMRWVDRFLMRLGVGIGMWVGGGLIGELVRGNAVVREGGGSIGE